MNFNINNNERLKRIAVLSTIVILLVGTVLGINLIRQRADIRNRAAGPPICSLESSCSVDPQYAGGEFVIKVYKNADTVPIVSGAQGEISVIFSADPVSTYRCEVESTVDQSCKEASPTLDAPICLAPTGTPPPTDTPAPPTPTASPTPTEGSEALCDSCTQIKFTYEFTTPTPSIPNFEVNIPNELLIGRVKIIPNQCDSFSCSDVERIYIAASSGPACPNVNDNTSIENYDPPAREDISCPLAVGDPNAQPPVDPAGAPFRLHQAFGDGCRYYQPRIDFKPTPGVASGAICSDCLQICCPQQCLPPEIIPNQDGNGCWGDPSLPAQDQNYDSNFNCYFDLTEPNSCPNINQLSRFRTNSGQGFNTNFIEFDDDFRPSQQSVGTGVDNPEFIYQDGGVYDVKLTCQQTTIDSQGQPQVNAEITCKKRVYVTCNSGINCPVINYVGGPTGGPTGAPICQ